MTRFLSGVGMVTLYMVFEHLIEFMQLKLARQRPQMQRQFACFGPAALYFFQLGLYALDIAHGPQFQQRLGILAL
ncbi:hypothetical protein D3C87_1589930 [compost metagenome]